MVVTILGTGKGNCACEVLSLFGRHGEHITTIIALEELQVRMALLPRLWNAVNVLFHKNFMKFFVIADVKEKSLETSGK